MERWAERDLSSCFHRTDSGGTQVEEKSSLLETVAASRSFRFSCLVTLFFCSSFWWAHSCPHEPLSVGVFHVPLLSPCPPWGETGTTDSFSGKSFISGREGWFYSCFSDLLQMTFSNHTVQPRRLKALTEIFLGR